jgi:hypothetical protein
MKSFTCITSRFILFEKKVSGFNIHNVRKTSEWLYRVTQASNPKQYVHPKMEYQHLTLNKEPLPPSKGREGKQSHLILHPDNENVTYIS